MRRAVSPGLREDGDVLRLDELGDLVRGEGQDAALRARLGAERTDPLEAVLLGRLDDAGHRLHRDDRVVADARLAGEHDRVGAVEDGVGDVGGLGARGHRGVGHRLEHLRRDDDGLGHAAAHLDGALLHDRHGLERQLDARSPRATMMPSNASMISSRLSTACGFSILAMTGTLRPSSAMISCTRVMSAASRTNDSAMRSAPA
jgi:hypothetical protein